MANRLVSFQLHIKCLFTNDQQACMSGMIDLHDYDDVKDNAENIFSVLENGTMPADETRPWPQEWIDIFRRWINEGCAP